MKKVILTSLFVSIYLIGNTQCISGDCKNGKGIFVYENDFRYEGIFKDGQCNGIGKLMYPDGSTYSGHFLNDKFDGKGKFVQKNVLTQDGYFLMNSFIEGTQTYINGTILKGKFKTDFEVIQGDSTTLTYLEGEGEMTTSDGYNVKGIFLKGIANGNMVVNYPNNDVFEGIFKNGQRNGEGILNYSKGGYLKGTWIDDKYVSGSEGNSINLIKLDMEDSGTYNVKIIINGMEANMTFDTGASMVNLTEDYLLPMYRAGRITEDDVVGGANFIDANGNVNYQAIINIKEIKIGNKTLQNIQVAVAPKNGLNLFGLNAIQALGENITIDFGKGELKYY